MIWQEILRTIFRVIFLIIFIGWYLGLYLHEKYPFWEKVLGICGAAAMLFGLSCMWVYAVAGGINL